MFVLIAGGTGLIGKRLIEMLLANGDQIRVLTRAPKTKEQFAWNPAAGTIDDRALEGVDVIINLAGAGIADKRWTAVRKKLLINSRVESTETLLSAIVRTGSKPKVFINASAIGIYGNSGEALQTEETPIDDSSGRAFMITCCALWEAAADQIATQGIRVVKLRIGVVMAKEGGALAEFIKPIRWGAGGYFGDGRAWYSWIHRDDLCQMILWAAQHPEIEGVFNGVAPNPVRNKALVKSIAKALKQPAIFAPAPSFLLRLVFGEMSAVLLNSNKVSAEKIEKTGFQFRFPTIDGALEDILKRSKT